MTDKEEWEHDPETRAWMLEMQRKTDLWERNYGMDSMDFFYRKCLECLQYVTELHWDSEWYKGAFETFQRECVRLSSELETAKRTEVGLNEWKEALFDAHIELKVACQPYAPNAVRGTESDHRRLEGINGTLETCRNVIQEMLRILNPEEKKYKVWYNPDQREQFLKDIGFLKGTLEPTVEEQKTLDGVKYRLIMKKVLSFESFWIYRIDDLVDSTTKRGVGYANLKERYHRILKKLEWFGIKHGQDPWLWPKIRTNVKESMQRIREIQAEIEGLDFEQFKTSPPTYYPFLSDFSVQNIIDAQQTMLTELATWLHDPWGREGPERPRRYTKIGGKQERTGQQEYWDTELRKYEEGYDNDTENADIYQEWVNGKLIKILTKEDVRKRYPDLKLSTKVTGMGALLSALGKYAE
jgi:hypothetical protein